MNSERERDGQRRGERKSEFGRCNGTQGSHGTFTPVFIHLRDIREEAACSMPNRAGLTENST